MYAGTGLLWSAWLAVAWVSHQPGVSEEMIVAANALMLLAGLASVVVILSILVQPMLNTARVWYDIGLEEQRRQCTCRPARAQEHAPIIPIRTGRRWGDRR